MCLGLAVSGVVRECPAGTVGTDLRLSRKRVLIETRDLRSGCLEGTHLHRLRKRT